MVHEDISSRGSPVTRHVYDGTCDKLVTDKTGGAENRHSCVKLKREEPPQATDLSIS